MSRQPRCDEPGAWHHVMNRGVARRTLFECERDIRNFLSRVARAVRRGSIEVHSYCVLSTHFHMLVRSPRGELSASLRDVQKEYARWFNRGRRRDGPLVRGRFRSKRVSSLTYRCHLVRYIDANAVLARLVAAPPLYPYGSARWYSRDRGPPWLERRWIEDAVRTFTGVDRYAPALYPAAFGEPLAPGLVRLVEQRLAHHGDPADPLDDLLGAAAPAVVSWMRRKAALADGTDVGLPVCDPAAVDAVVSAAAAESGAWRVCAARKQVEAWPQVRVGLLRELCAVTLADVAARVSLSQTGAWTAHRRHRELVTDSDDYALRVAELARTALQVTHRPTASPPGSGGRGVG